MKLYKDIASTSWLVTKKNPVLWLFGFFMLFWMGKGMELESYFTGLDLYRSQFSPLNPSFWHASGWQNVLSLSGMTVSTLAILFASLALIFIFVFALIVVSQIGLVDGFAHFASPRKRKRYSIVDAVNLSRKHFLSVAVINLLGKGASFVLLAVAAIPLFMADAYSTQVTFSFILYLLVAPVVILLSIWITYATNDVVLNETQIDEAMNNGWLLLRHNVGVSIEMAILLYASYIFVLVAGFVLNGLITLPLSFMIETLEWVVPGNTLYDLLVILVALLGTVVMVAGVILFSTWSHGCWTRLYIELTKGKKRSKIHRLLTDGK